MSSPRHLYEREAIARRPVKEPEVRRAELAAALERNRAVGLAEGLSDDFITQSNNDLLRAFDVAEAIGSLFRGMR